MGADSAVPGVNRNAVYAKKVACPGKAVFDEYDSRAQAFLRHQGMLRKQNVGLETLRDTLLPKLLSGELRIPEAEKQVADLL